MKRCLKSSECEAVLGSTKFSGLIVRGPVICFPFQPVRMPKKKVDGRIRTLIENGVKSRTRTFFVIVGDRGKDQVVNLHYILSKAQVKARPSVLWCYNKELGFST